MSLALALGTGFVLSFAMPAQAVTDKLDQAQPLTMGLESVGQMAQTFTAGMTGQLDRVSLPTDTAFATFTVQVESVSGIFPAGTAVLGTSSFSGSYLCCRTWHDYTFSPTIPVTAGGHYAIVVKVAGRSHLSWYTSDGLDAYAGGSLYLGCLNCAWGTDNTYGGDYAFQTWVIGGSAPPPNHAPTVAVDSPTVNVNEGTAPLMTGTFLDPDGDTVTLTASAGTVTPNGTSGGTWSWTQPASDEPSAQTVTVKADDGKGLSSTATFTTTTTGVAPTVSISRGSGGPAAASTAAPASTPEGTAVNLNGSATSPSAEDTAAGFTYSWSVTKDGAAFGTGSAAAFSFTPNDEGTYVATFTAKDDGGLSASTSMTFIGANVAPSAKITSIGWTTQLGLTPNQQVNFAGSFTDPGSLDTHAATWKFGDGAGSTGLTASHAYSAAGTYTVTFTVTDDDNGAGQATATVTVLSPQQALSSIGAYIQNLKSLNGGQKNSLMAKIDAANASIARGNATAATNQLNALLNECQADLNSGRITSTDMVTIRDEVHAVQAAIGTYNRFLEWWPLGA